MKKTSKPGLYKGFSKEDEKTIVPVGYLNGYHFGDRLLEDVYFRCEILPGGSLEVSTAPSHCKYMEDLNERKWVEAAFDYATRDDLADDFAEKEDGNGEQLVLEKL